MVADTQPEPITELNGLKPMPGQLFALPKEALGPMVGGIHIPEVARRNPGFRATVIAENPRRGRDISGLVGREVLFATWAGAAFDWRCTHEGREYESIIRYHLSVGEIVAIYWNKIWEPIVEASGEALPGEIGIQRCRRCKSKGQGNMMLDGNGICPTCGRDASGRKPMKWRNKMYAGTEREEIVETDYEVTMSEEEAELFGTPKPKVVKGTVFSYDKQGRRS
jgi:hypothetical protein